MKFKLSRTTSSLLIKSINGAGELYTFTVYVTVKC